VAAVVFYISGHGFGHASRQIEVINALGAAAPDLQVVVRTSAPKWLFRRTARVPIAFDAVECDTGVVQVDSLRLDERGSIERAGEFHRTLPARARDEATLLRSAGARLVVSDAPPLACAAAADAGIPAVVVSNFTWDWIYEEYAEHLPVAPDLIPTIRSAYARADGAWRLPMHGGFEAFSTIRDVPFVARHARHEPEDVRRRLGLPLLLPLVLVSFGGYGVENLDIASLDCLEEYGVVLTHADGSRGPSRPGVFHVSESALYADGLRYEDLVRAVDVVVTKPGYGIIAECIANGTALLYTSRGRFAEYDVLVAEMPRFLPCAFVDRGALLAGRWRDALERLSSSPAPPERPATDGAEVIAGMLAALARG
jgi:L-arabinokinase